jgi:hypothetical protein
MTATLRPSELSNDISNDLPTETRLKKVVFVFKLHPIIPRAARLGETTGFQLLDIRLTKISELQPCRLVRIGGETQGEEPNLGISTKCVAEFLKEGPRQQAVAATRTKQTVLALKAAISTHDEVSFAAVSRTGDNGGQGVVVVPGGLPRPKLIVGRADGRRGFFASDQQNVALSGCAAAISVLKLEAQIAPNMMSRGASLMRVVVAG